MKLTNKDILMPAVKKLLKRVSELEGLTISEDNMELLISQFLLSQVALCPLPYTRTAVFTTLVGSAAAGWITNPTVNISNQEILDIVLGVEKEVSESSNVVSLV